MLETKRRSSHRAFGIGKTTRIECLGWLWSDLNSTHLNRLRQLPHQVVKQLVWGWAKVEVFRDSLCHHWMGVGQPQICRNFTKFPDDILL